VAKRAWRIAASHRQSLKRRLALSLLAFPALVVVGALGYVLIEGWSFSDALFMSATTITTVGYGEVHPLSEGGRLFTIALLLVGLAAIWYALNVLVSVVIEGEIGLRWEERRMERQIRQARGHHVVAGFGRVGRQTAQALRALGHQVVVIDANPTAVAEAMAAGFLAVGGNATEDETLIEAGVERAAGLIAALGTDAGNVFVTLSAKALNATLPIVARANESGAAPKLIRAGAARVVSPYDMAGRQMARLALRPGTVDFIENLFKGATGDLVLEDIRVESGSRLDGMTIAELRDQAPRALFLAVLRDGGTISPPPADLRLAVNDELAAVGEEGNLRFLEELSQRSGTGEGAKLPVEASG
jgi:voltage-gated potassium channel